MLYPLSYEGLRADPSRSAGGPLPGPSHEMNLTVCQGTAALPCGRTVDLPAGGQVISLSAVS